MASPFLGELAGCWAPPLLGKHEPPPICATRLRQTGFGFGFGFGGEDRGPTVDAIHFAPKKPKGRIRVPNVDANELCVFPPWVQSGATWISQPSTFSEGLRPKQIVEPIGPHVSLLIDFALRRAFGEWTQQLPSGRRVYIHTYI